MTSILLALVLSVGAPSAGTVGTGATYSAAVLAIDSVTSSTLDDMRNQGGVQSVTNVSVPNNGLVVVMVTSDYDPVPDGVTTITSTNLTWTQRAMDNSSATNTTVEIWTATNTSGSTKTETITNTMTLASGRFGMFTAIVLTGANLSALTNAVISPASGQTTSQAFSASVTCAGSSSYVFGVAFSHAWSSGVTPDAGFTEIVDTTEARGGNFWYARSTDKTSGTVAIGGSWSSSQAWVAAAIEIQSQ